MLMPVMKKAWMAAHFQGWFRAAAWLKTELGSTAPRTPWCTST